MKLEPHHPIALIEDALITEKILEEDTLWIAKQMLGNAAERKIIKNVLVQNKTSSGR